MTVVRSGGLVRAFAFLALSLCSAVSLAQQYEVRRNHDPDGIGKFYMGREIAAVMGPGGISWLERPTREAEEQPEKAIAALDIKPGQTVADFGAGSGYYSFRIAPLVGSSGKVLAVDIEPKMIRAITARATREGIRNVEPVQSAVDDPKLAPASIDLLFMVDVYHELEFPYEVMTKIRTALKPGGRVALIEYKKEDPAVMIKEVHKMSRPQILKEMQAAGFKQVKTVSLPLQHLMMFERR
jgi:predicted methyltransferase